ncbi:Cof-type HAD-IIB family hydrolase [Paenibacillus sp.]|uniref:Cof-type HAD-IIB family hydrolase n=1 Tax=Paenibacillus sp. TaxID=58172 RepID=UPI002D2B3524|nr:Cof-type HAD-IIB family hydrolase [Paenibacillus sp.]HZG57582.1 Cof-type HAD-IIB family hydrolase [Paenibacillus sp.]
MGKPYKLLALDMDGTLLNEKSEISDANERWIREAIDAGIAVCFATGRGYASALPFAQRLALTSPMVLVNGGEVWASPDRLHSRETMPAEDIVSLRDIALRYDTWYWGYSVDRVFNKNDWLEDPFSTEWLKFGFFTEDEAALAAVAADVLALPRPFETTNSHPNNLELNPLGVSKASGLRQVCAMLGCDMREVVACGDSLNDAAMIREAGLGVAMGNAQDAVKRIADAVTLTNEEDGVAHVIRTYLL